MIAVIFLGGLVLRALMLFSTKSLWGDEVYSVNFSFNKSVLDVILHCFETNHPPLHSLFLSLITKFFGGQEVMFRSLSFVPGVLTVWLVYLLARRLFDKPAAIAASLMAALSPYLLQSSNEIRAYSLVACLSTLVLFFMLKSIKKNKYTPTYVFLSALLPYVEHMGVFVFIATTTCLVLTKEKKMFVPQCVVFFLQIPWALLVAYQAVYHEKIFQVARVSEYWNAPWILKKGVGIFWHLVCGYQFSMLTVQNVLQKLKTDPQFWLQAVVVLMTAAVLAKAFAVLFKTRSHAFYLFVFIFLLPFLLLLVFYPIRLSARYLSFSAPLFFVVVGYGFAALKPRPLKILCLGALCVSNFAADLHMIALKTDAIHKSDFRGMVEYVSKASHEHTIIVGSQKVYRYYVGQSKLRNDLVSYDDPKDLDRSNTQGASEIWILKEINMHPKVTDRIIGEYSAYLRQLGFAEQKRIRFGGEEGLTMAVLYIKETTGAPG